MKKIKIKDKNLSYVALASFYSEDNSLILIHRIPKSYGNDAWYVSYIYYLVLDPTQI